MFRPGGHPTQFTPKGEIIQWVVCRHRSGHELPTCPVHGHKPTGRRILTIVCLMRASSQPVKPPRPHLDPALFITRPVGAQFVCWVHRHFRRRLEPLSWPNHAHCADVNCVGCSSAAMTATVGIVNSFYWALFDTGQGDATDKIALEDEKDQQRRD